MNTHADKTQEKKSQSVANAVSRQQSGGGSTFQFVDNRPEAIVQRKLQEMAKNSPQVKPLRTFQGVVNNYSSQQQQPIQKKENNIGLPDNLKSGIENLSGYSMDDVKVHYNSDKPAQLQAHAYAQGTDIHLGRGQEKHLPHEAWHVVQQKQGRVKPNLQMKEGIPVNDDSGLEHEADVMGAKALQRVRKQGEVKNTRPNPNSFTVQRKNTFAGPELTTVLNSKLPQNSAPVRQGIATGVVQRNKKKAVARRTMKGAALGTGVGAAFGSVIPVVGTAIGATIGAGVSTLAFLWREYRENKTRERISRDHGITISSDISGKILSKIEGVLASLPMTHTKWNLSLTDIIEDGVGNASVFDGDHTIGICTPSLPLPGHVEMPDALYASLDKSSEWQRRLIDAGAMPDFSAETDIAYELNPEERHVMAGVSDVNSQENLLSWTVRHEIGHSIDKKIGWKDGYSNMAIFGAWIEHNDQEEVFGHFLQKAGISSDYYNANYPLNPFQNIPLIEKLSQENRNTLNDLFLSSRWTSWVTDREELNAADFNNQVRSAIKSLEISKNAPWTFDDGCQGDLAFNGRLYMKGQYGPWESYLTAARANAVSNYQFSNVDEWFAEAYAAYYKPEENAASRAQLSGQQRAWFLGRLGRYKT